MTLVHQSIRAVTRCHIGPTRIGNMIARWAQRRFADDWAARSEQDVITEHYDPSLRMRVNPMHHIGGAIYWRGAYARRILRCLDQLLGPQMVFVDIGANQGEMTIFAARRLSHGTVIAFEPVADNFRRLLDNVQLNELRNVIGLNYCLGIEAGELPLYAPEERSLHHRQGWNEGLPSLFARGADAIAIETVAVRRFDDVLPTLGVKRIDVMKIDVEGAELDVLKGAQESLLRFRPAIVVEINASTLQSAGRKPTDVCSYLQSLGYDGFQLDRHGNRGKAIGVSSPDDCDALWIPRDDR